MKHVRLEIDHKMARYDIIIMLNRVDDLMGFTLRIKLLKQFRVPAKFITVYVMGVRNNL